MLATNLPLHLTLTTGVGDQKVFFSFLKVAMFYIKLTGMKQANILSFYTPSAPGSGQIKKKFWRRLCCISNYKEEVLNIMQLKCLTLCTPLAFWEGKKVRHWNSADKYILIELCDLIGFGYDLSDTQDGLKVELDPFGKINQCFYNSKLSLLS